MHVARHGLILVRPTGMQPEGPSATLSTFEVVAALMPMMVTGASMAGTSAVGWDASGSIPSSSIFEVKGQFLWDRLTVCNAA